MEKEQWAEAEQKLERAFALRPHFQIAANLGTAEQQLGKHAKAARHLHYALAEMEKEPGNEEQRAQVKTLLGEAKRRVGTIDVAVSPQTRVSEIRVDGIAVADPRAPLFLAPGAHQIEVTAADGKRAAKNVTATEGRVETVLFTLAPSVGDGAGVGPVRVPDGGSGEAEQTDGASTWARIGPGVGATLLGLGFIGAGVGFRVRGGGREGDADALRDALVAGGGSCPASGCVELVDAYGKADKDYNASTGFFASGAVLVVLGVGGIVVGATVASSEQARLPIRPVIATGSDGAFIGVRGEL